MKTLACNLIFKPAKNVLDVAFVKAATSQILDAYIICCVQRLKRRSAIDPGLLTTAIGLDLTRAILQLGDGRGPGLGLGAERGRQAGDQLGQGRRATATADPARSAGAVASAGIKNGGRSRRAIRESGV